jgi:phage baseplate assembly protein V
MLMEGTVRRVRLMVSRAILTLIDTSGGRVSVQSSLLAGELSDGVEYFEHYGFTSAPFPGAEGIFLSVGGSRDSGVIVATGDRRYHMRGLAPGEVAIFDDQGQAVYLTRAGIKVVGAGLPLTVTDTPKIRCETALLECTGDIRDNCDTQTRSMADMRQIYDTHTHPDPQGGSVGTTSETM